MSKNPIKVSLREDLDDDGVTGYKHAFTRKWVDITYFTNRDAYELSEDFNGDYIVFIAENLPVIIPSIDLEFI